jgi:hypothetical protein
VHEVEQIKKCSMFLLGTAFPMIFRSPNVVPTFYNTWKYYALFWAQKDKLKPNAFGNNTDDFTAGLIGQVWR